MVWFCLIYSVRIWFNPCFAPHLIPLKSVSSFLMAYTYTYVHTTKASYVSHRQVG